MIEWEKVKPLIAKEVNDCLESYGFRQPKALLVFQTEKENGVIVIGDVTPWKVEVLSKLRGFK